MKLGVLAVAYPRKEVSVTHLREAVYRRSLECGQRERERGTSGRRKTRNLGPTYLMETQVSNAAKSHETKYTSKLNFISNLHRDAASGHPSK